ncbi:BDC_1c_G0031310.mRNA.1.CDS.1 [Saccharomyces cerevisiae]|nr:AIG_G0006540.mRNA.1.CDS.1 [Saccharomyces cerevisiae]CAI4562333.1 BDF_1d_G0031270.mRNA.1.CDS.1 [Saccharomyces cerevisiae]CAI4568384.1 BDC_1c_G0031310.mRNA.1.CDS.1 [Saccharomyces cerevisiae]CAI6527604.1 AIG_G0006540.mRNA.1.CDS.1 [Saccharomyces cerevisiae]CAI6641573.1 AAB_G0016690.mRNA.1.CDS.1 [Saccharomyces cerevisiae]
MSTPIIRVHWLNESRAFRVLQLLEQLKLDYEIVPYKRNQDFRAPEDAKKIHPLGRFPVVELEDRTTGKKKVLAESGYIFHYILQHLDSKGLLKNNDPDQAEQIEYFLYYAEGSLQLPLMVEFILSMTKKAPIPFPLSYLSGKVADKISEKYSKGELQNQLKFVEGEIAKNQGYLVGGKLSGADILMLFPLQSALNRGFAKREEYPHIGKFVDTLTALDSYSAAKAKATANGGKF